MTFFAGNELTEELRRGAELVLSRGKTADGSPVLVLAPASKQPSPATLDRLAREFAFRDELDPAWAVRPLALHQAADGAALVLADPGGDTLERTIARRAGPVAADGMASGLRIAAAMARALAGVHECGLIHKDVNPGNLLVDEATGEVRLTGFGVASRMPREQQHAPPIEVIVGTFPYMAPEQTGRMNRSVDSRCDLYSLGVTCYELFTGHLPFSASDPMEWVHCHIARQPAPPAERAPELPAPVSGIIMKLLAKTAEDRYQTAQAVAADFARCLAEWTRTGRIADFALAAEDIPGWLMVPEKLYGREEESRRLLGAFDRVAHSGTPELVLVSGYSGVGKSALGNQIHAAMVERRGLYGAGKFDQHKRDTPYATFAQAFHALVRHILSTGEQEAVVWRRALLDALGPNGRLVVDLIPQLERVIGEQPAVTEMPPSEARARFLAVFRSFVSVFGRPGQPLVLFLDDLQWMDPGSMTLLMELTTHPEVHNLLLIGSYRDNEVDSAHPLALTIESIRGAGCPVCDIVLTPLSRGDLGQLVADTLHCSPAAADPLVGLVHDKTAGNPFFAIQFLTALVDEQLLRFDAAAGRWTWEMEAIRAKGFSDNVAELMAAKLRRLDQAAQTELRRVACLGSGARIATLAMVYGRSEDELVAAVADTVRAGFLIRSGDRLVFPHDRILEAVTQSIPPAERAGMHLHVGRRMLERMDPAEIDEQIFEVAHQLNLGRDLITDSAELAELGRLNVVAGRRAKSSSAYASAQAHFLQARALLPADCWDRGHAETFDLFVELAECEYLVGNHDAAGELFTLLLDQARSDRQRARVWRLRFRMYMVAGRFGDAVAIAIEALRQFGLACPDSESDTAAAVEAARRELGGLLHGRRIPDLVGLPDCADAAVAALIGIIADAIPAVYHVRPLLYPFLGLSGIILSLRHGVTEDSCSAFSGYSVSLVGRFEDIAAGLEFSELALALGERFSSTQLRGTLLFRHGYFVSPWRRSVSACMPVLDECFRVCVETGNLIYAAYVAYASAWMLFERGDPLDSMLALLEKYAPFARTNRIAWATLMIRFQQLFVTGLQGGAATEGEDAADAVLAEMKGTGHGYGIAFCHVVRQVTPYLMGRYEEALAASRDTAAMWAKISSSLIDSSHQFYSALTMTALVPAAGPARRREFLAALGEHRRKLKLWADHCPETFASRSLLVEAEMARVDGRADDALRLYEEAIAASRDTRQHQCEAIANELAGRLCLDRGLHSIAEVYLRNARYCFERWGALAKVRQLDQHFPGLADTPQRRADSAPAFSGPVEGLDLMAVVKAQQVVSGEIVLGKLVESLLRIVVEHAGADRGLLILRHGQGYRIEAEAVTDGDRIKVASCALPPAAAQMALPVFHYVVRARDRVVLDNAAGPNPFETEEYARRTGVKSVLCLPVVTHGELTAVLYLENRLASAAFTQSRVAVLDLLASQASISLENAMLYAEMEERVRDRTRELAESLETVRSKSEQVSALLNNSGQGFLSFGADLMGAPEFSHACLDLLGCAPAGRPIDLLLFGDDARTRETLRACVKEGLAAADADRSELYLSLIPGEVVIGDKTLAAEFKAVDQSIMLVLTDVTEEKALAAQVAREQRRLEMIVTAVTSGNDFFEIIGEFREFISAGVAGWSGRSKANLYRAIHTFKGSFNQFGFHHVPQALHAVEASVQSLPDDASCAEAAAIIFAVDWPSLLDGDLATVTMALGEDFMARRGVVTVTPDQAQRFERLARELIHMRGLPVDVLNTLEEMASIRTISLRHALGEFVKLIRQVALRLDKEVAPLVVEGEDVRVDPGRFGPFLRSLGHVFRNAIDHGIEDPDSRLAAGKNEMGTITCGISRDGGALHITIADDGRGIDVDTLRQRVACRGSANVADWAVADLVFADGISVRGDASEMSGRGIGMAAVRAAVEDLGGSIDIRTEEGHGTAFVFEIPFPDIGGGRGISG